VDTALCGLALTFFGGMFLYFQRDFIASNKIEDYLINIIVLVKKKYFPQKTLYIVIFCVNLDKDNSFNLLKWKKERMK
jgi:hypothetical protein